MQCGQSVPIMTREQPHKAMSGCHTLLWPKKGPQNVKRIRMGFFSLPFSQLDIRAIFLTVCQNIFFFR